MVRRKYISEFGLISVAAYRFLLQQDHLNEIADTGIKPHIYFIGRRPRVMLDETSVKFSTGHIRGDFLIQRGLDVERHPFLARNELGTDKLTLECPYPHTEFAFRNASGAVLSNGKVANLMANIDPKFWDLLNLEVLYVGQAYGQGGERTADVRLASHATLQGIYAEAIRLAPDQDIWLVLCTFDMQVIASFDGLSKDVRATTAEDDAHIANVIDNPITEQQQINFTEAALIRYFQPEYNVIYKDSFPNPAHATYAQCYDLDISMVVAEINTEPIFLQLYSATVPPSWVHFAQFDLHDRTERRAMFDLLD